MGLLCVDYRVVFNDIKHKKRKDREIRRRTEVRKKNNRILLENGIFGMYWPIVMSKFEVYKHIIDNFSLLSTYHTCFFFLRIQDQFFVSHYE